MQIKTVQNKIFETLFNHESFQERILGAFRPLFYSKEVWKSKWGPAGNEANIFGAKVWINKVSRGLSNGCPILNNPNWLF